MTILNPSDTPGLALSTPGSILMANADGVLQWHENRPPGPVGFQQAYTTGTPGTSVWNQVVTGTGAAFTRQQGVTYRTVCITQLETGTVSNGRASLQAMPGSAILATAGTTNTFECLVMVPILPTAGVEDFVISNGILNRSDNAAGDGARFTLTSGSANWQAQVLASTTATIDTGIPCVAGTWYRMRIVCVGYASTFYLIKDDDYHANGRSYGAAVASSSARDFSAVALVPTISIIKTAGTTMRGLQYSFVNWTRTPSRSTPTAAEVSSAPANLTPGDGLSLPQALPGQRLLVDSQGRPYWDDYKIDTDHTPFFVRATGAFDGSMTSRVSGTGANVSRSTISGSAPHLFLSTGTTATGFSEWGLLKLGESETVFLQDGSVEIYPSLLVYETKIVTCNTLSNAADTYVQRFGFYDSTFTYGVWFELDANTDTHWRIGHTSAGAAAYTATTLVGPANTEFWLRIVWEPGGDAICTIGQLGSNINTLTVTLTPSFTASSWFHAGAGIYKLGGTTGTTARTVELSYQTVYQRYL